MRIEGCVLECRACRYADVSDENELAAKALWLGQKLASWNLALEKINSSSPRWGVRDKVTLKANLDSGKWQFGLMQRDEFLAIPGCPLHTPRINSLMRLFQNIPASVPLSHVAVVGGQLTFILRSKKEWMPEMDRVLLDFCSEIKGELKELLIEGIWLNWNPVVGRWLTLHKNWQFLLGEKESRHPTGEWYGPSGFGQVHWPLYMQALARIDSFLAEAKPEAYLELYCGIGVGLGRWQNKVKSLLGVELSGESVGLIAKNAPKAQILRGTCGQRVPQFSRWYDFELSHGEVALFVNPPRSGLEVPVIDWLCKARPARFAYMSCSPNTLARDLFLLQTSGMKIDSLVPFDFFPKTRHVEVLALLSRA